MLLKMEEAERIRRSRSGGRVLACRCQVPEPRVKSAADECYNKRVCCEKQGKEGEIIDATCQELNVLDILGCIVPHVAHVANNT